MYCVIGDESSGEEQSKAKEERKCVDEGAFRDRAIQKSSPRKWPRGTERMEGGEEGTLGRAMPGRGRGGSCFGE